MDFIKNSILLAKSRFKRDKSTTLFMVLAIFLAISLILSITLGTRHLQTTIILDGFDNSIISTDISMGISLPLDDKEVDLTYLSDQVSHLSSINQAFLKYHGSFSRSWFANNLTNHIWIDSKTTSLQPKRWKLDVFGFDSTQLSNYIDYTNLTTSIDNNQLSINQTIISYQLAQKFNLSINDTIYVHYSGNLVGTGYYPISNRSFPLTISNIVVIPSGTLLAKDIVRNPFSPNSEGTIEDIVILESSTYLNVINYLAQNNGEIFTSQLSFSVYLHENSVIASYNREKTPIVLENIEKVIIAVLKDALPTGSLVYSSNLILSELFEHQSDINHLQDTLLIMTSPVIILIIIVTMFARDTTIDKQIRSYIVLVCRCMPEKDIRNSFIIEGALTGVIAAISSAIGSIFITSAFYFIYPNDMVYNDWFVFMFNDFLSLLINAMILGITIGVLINYIASRKILDIYPADILLKDRNISNWVNKKPRKTRLILFTTIFLVSNWLIIQLFILAGFTDVFGMIILILENISSSLMLLLPIVLFLLFLVIVVNRRDLLARYITSFSFYLDKTLRENMYNNYLRRPKVYSRVAIILALAFAAGITPIVMAESAEDIAIRELKTETGSDIIISSAYDQLINITRQDLLKLSSNIEEVSPMIWIKEAYTIYWEDVTNVGGYTESAAIRNGLIAIQPDTYIKTGYFEDCFTHGENPSKMLSKLNSSEARILEPLGFTSTDLGSHSVGKVTKIRLPEQDVIHYYNFTVTGFFNLFPAHKNVENEGLGLPSICSIDYLISKMVIPLQTKMFWLVKIDPTVDNNAREQVFQSFKAFFNNPGIYDIQFLDDVLSSIKNTPTGNIIVIMDSIFFVVLLFSLFGLGLNYHMLFDERRAEMAVYQSRGMKLGDIRLMLYSELLALDALGAFFGIIVGFSLAFFYIDLFIVTSLPVYIFIPWIKIASFILLVLISQLLLVTGQVFFYTRYSIVSLLRIRD